jgi:hypothetical protein
MIQILPLLFGNMLSDSTPVNSYHSEQQKQNKKQFLAKLKYKSMLVKIKASYGGDGFKEQLINLSMIKEVRPGWNILHRLSKDEWCEVHFIDGSNVYVETTLNEMLAKLWDIQDREINVRTSERRTGRGPL